MCVSHEFAAPSIAGGIRSFPFPRAFPRARALFRALRPYRSPRRVAAVFRRHEGAALEPLRARSGARLLVLQHFPGRGLAVVLRTVAEPLGIRVVVPAAPVAGDAVDDLETDVGPVDRDADELREIARRNPDREPALVRRPRSEVADAHAHHFHAVLVGVEAAERL